VRTFVIGLSSQTTGGSARTELNRIAFAGRTDASDELGGIDYPGDDVHWTNFDSANNYAYFAANATELSASLRRIVTSIAAVDLATSPPVTTGAQEVATFDGAPVGLLTSSEFPESYGHLRLFNLELEIDDPDYLIWDAGQELTDRDLVAAPRMIYTSDPDSDPPNQLVPLVPADSESATALNTLLGGLVASDDEAMSLIDLLHGLPVPEQPGVNGSPTHSRPWRLGDVVNSTPAIRGAPPRYTGFPDHRNFAFQHQDRHPVVFVGASDLMLHAFDLVDGEELWAYVPPSLLPNLVEQRDQWVVDGYEFMGQPFASIDHIYGVASSPRLTDISDGAGGWMTTLISGLGPGGPGVFALDVTSIYPGRTIDGNTHAPDHAYDADQPFRVLWTRSDGDTGFEDLGETWSVPAVGYGALAAEEGEAPGDERGWVAALGSAYGGATQGKFVHLVNALTGELVAKTGEVALEDRDDQLVTDNYYFADTVGYSSERLSGEAPLDLEIQADLAGQVWGTTVSDTNYDHELLFDVGADQPIYFAPSVATFRTAGPFTTIAYASGSYDETERMVNGSASMMDAKLYISVSEVDGDAEDTLEIDVTDTNLMTKPDGSAFTAATRPVSTPLTFVRKSGNPLTFFTLFDPEPIDGDCFGRSFIVVVEFEPDPFGVSSTSISVNAVGSGKVSGFGIGSGAVVVGQTGTGGDSAKIVPVEDMDILPPIGNLEVTNWKELF
jgi:Tfp pilus tip-associated adhesin PilY1